jgi:pantoate--beta-alanine ligase
MAVPVARTAKSLRRAVVGWRDAGDRVALVPTMGALHAGHLALVRLARKRAERVVVSIFVNPTQFGPGEDLSTYPRTFDDDRRQLGGMADLIFAPSAEEMYPQGAATTVAVAGPATAGLEDRFRPTHFPGVATVVAKLLIQAAPDIALFGEKDYQQLKVVTRMAADLHLPVRIVPGPTVREPDGLALSSRNRYLSPAERAKAPLLHRALQASAEAIRAGTPVADALAQARRSVTSAGFELDYLEARDGDTLEPVPAAGEAPVRLLVAARIGTTRLIDNIAV